MRDIDVVCNNYCREVTIEQALNFLAVGRTIEVRIYNEKDQIKHWEKYNAKCNPQACWSFEEMIKGRFFLVFDEGV